VFVTVVVVMINIIIIIIIFYYYITPTTTTTTTRWVSASKLVKIIFVEMGMIYLVKCLLIAPY
jgi:hypothetical protein